jgi:hypothetical protein
MNPDIKKLKKKYKTNKYPYKCPYCSRKFHNKIDLTLHMFNCTKLGD